MITSLADQWRAEATVARRIGADAQAMTLEKCAEELEALTRVEGTELLNLTQAGLRSGYSPDSLRRMIHEGRLTNYGRKNAPRVRATDLPRKALRPAVPPLQLAGASRQKARVSTTTPRGS